MLTVGNTASIPRSFRPSVSGILLPFVARGMNLAKTIPFPSDRSMTDLAQSHLAQACAVRAFAEALRGKERA